MGKTYTRDVKRKMEAAGRALAHFDIRKDGDSYLIGHNLKDAYGASVAEINTGDVKFTRELAHCFRAMPEMISALKRFLEANNYDEIEAAKDEAVAALKLARVKLPKVRVA